MDRSWTILVICSPRCPRVSTARHWPTSADRLRPMACFLTIFAASNVRKSGTPGRDLPRTLSDPCVNHDIGLSILPEVSTKRGTRPSFSAMTGCSKYGSSWRLARSAISATALPISGMLLSEVPFRLRRRAHVHSGGRSRGVFSRTPQLLHSHRRRFPIEAVDANLVHEDRAADIGVPDKVGLTNLYGGHPPHRGRARLRSCYSALLRRSNVSTVRFAQIAHVADGGANGSNRGERR